MIFTESSFHIAKFVAFGEGYGALFHGKVVDMLYFPMVDTILPKWIPFFGEVIILSFFAPVFNIADAAISTGVITLLLFQKRLLHKKGNSVVPITE